MKFNINQTKMSKIAPTSFKASDTYVIVGDKYERHFLVTALPNVFGLGMLSDYVSNPSIKVLMLTSHLNMNCASMLKKEYNEKMDRLKKTKDPSERENLELQLRSLNTYIQEVSVNNDSTLNVVIVFQIRANNLKTLNEISENFKANIRASGFKVIAATLMQENILRLATPVFSDSKLPQIIEDNIGVPLPALGVAGMYPFVYETLKDPKGFILGYELGNNGVICFDQFYYKNNPAESKLFNRLNGNMIIAGGSGFGKTTALNLLVRSYIRQKKKLIWIDPENKNRRLTKKYHGIFINWGQKGNLINIFDLKPISVEEDENSELIKWDTRQAIYNVVDDIKIVLKYLKPSINEDTLTVISEVAFKTYENAGYNLDKSFKGKTKEFSPTFTDFNNALSELITEYSDKVELKRRLDLMYDLQLKLEPLLNEYSTYFNGKTSIDFSNSERSIVSFGTKILYDKSQELKDALNHIMYQYAWSLCLDEREDSAFVLDEAHVDIHTETSAKMVAQFVRRSRKYNNVVAIATQEPKDFAVDHMYNHGKSMFNNSIYKLILHLEEDPLFELRKLMRINDSEADLISSFMQGDALFVCGNRHIPIHILPTENELKEMS